MGKGVESRLLLEEGGGWAAGLRVKHRCLFLLNCGEEILHNLGTVGGFGRRARGARLGATGSGFFRSYGGQSTHGYVRGREGLTWLGEFLGDSSGLPSGPRSLLVRLVLDSVLFKVWIVQILLQRVNEGHWCLSL